MFPLEQIPAGFHLLFASCALIIGLCLGSFFNVCIYRIPLGQSLSDPKRSYCFSCGSMVEARDNIPLLSYLALRGACRHCGGVYSSRYFWVEALTGALFLFAYLTFSLTPALLAYWTFIGLMIIATFTDIDNWIIPDRISLGGCAVGIVFSSFLPFVDSKYVMAVEDWNSFTYALANLLVLVRQVPDGVLEFLVTEGAWWRPLADAVGAAAFGYGMLLLVRVFGQLLFRREAMGMGDLKLFACIGAFLGWLNAIYVLMIACVLGSVIGGSQLIAHRLAARKAARGGAKAKVLHPLPFGPYIAVAAVVALLFHERIPAALEAFSRLFNQLYGIPPGGY